MIFVYSKNPWIFNARFLMCTLWFNRTMLVDGQARELRSTLLNILSRANTMWRAESVKNSSNGWSNKILLFCKTVWKVFKIWCVHNISIKLKSKEKCSGPLSNDEIQKSIKTFIKLLQNQFFGEELSNSKLQSLNPLFDLFVFTLEMLQTWLVTIGIILWFHSCIFLIL